MKKTREADQKPVAEVAKKHGIGDQTIYAWRQQYGTLEVCQCEAPAPIGAGERPAEGDSR